jgi:hypothetical protein
VLISQNFFPKKIALALSLEPSKLNKKRTRQHIKLNNQTQENEFRATRAEG